MRWGWVSARQRQSICRARAGVREFTSLLAASPAPWARGCVIRYTHIPTHATGNLLADWVGSMWKDCRPLPSSRQRARAGQPAEVFVLSQQQPPSLHATLTLTTPERKTVHSARRAKHTKGADGPRCGLPSTVWRCALRHYAFGHRCPPASSSLCPTFESTLPSEHR
jgi:hypothetical protein